jgi:Ca-activated chloride channel family protein
VKHKYGRDYTTLTKGNAFINVGHNFRATDNKKLEAIYEEIDRLEKTDIEEFKYYNYEEKFRPFVLWALGLLIFEFLIRYSILRSFI